MKKTHLSLSIIRTSADTQLGLGFQHVCADGHYIQREEIQAQETVGGLVS